MGDTTAKFCFWVNWVQLAGSGCACGSVYVYYWFGPKLQDPFEYGPSCVQEGVGLYQMRPVADWKSGKAPWDDLNDYLKFGDNFVSNFCCRCVICGCRFDLRGDKNGQAQLVPFSSPRLLL